MHLHDAKILYTLLVCALNLLAFHLKKKNQALYVTLDKCPLPLLQILQISSGKSEELLTWQINFVLISLYCCLEPFVMYIGLKASLDYITQSRQSQSFSLREMSDIVERTALLQPKSEGVTASLTGMAYSSLF